ncbi:MAG: alanine racemase [Candidatus Binatia bacterium]|jgi:alanine racemase
MTTPLAGRPTFAAIDAAALRANFAAVRAALPADVAVLAVVKANAYGHGAALVAPIFEAAGADYLGVATIEEGVELRAAGVRKPILVLTGARAGDVAACHVIGAMCMDLTMVDVTEVGGVQLGDEVVLWGRQNGAEISVTEVAAWQETIAYEVLTGVGQRVPRILQ